MLQKDLRELTGILEQKTFFDLPINVRAKQDFLYLCNKTGYSAIKAVDKFVLRMADSASKRIGEFLVIGYDTSQGTVYFPKELIDVENPECYVAVVCYDDKDVVDVLVFAAKNFQSTRLMSIFKNDKKRACFGISLGDAKNPKLQKHAFGLVVKSLC